MVASLSFLQIHLEQEQNLIVQEAQQGWQQKAPLWCYLWTQWSAPSSA